MRSSRRRASPGTRHRQCENHEDVLEDGPVSVHMRRPMKSNPCEEVVAAGPCGRRAGTWQNRTLLNVATYGEGCLVWPKAAKVVVRLARPAYDAMSVSTPIS